MQGLFTDGEIDRGEKTRWALLVIIRLSVAKLWIFLRPRNAGLSTTVDSIIEDLEGDVMIPEGLSSIVGVETEVTSASQDDCLDDENHVIAPTPEPDILFSKPANSEQYEIAARLAKNRAVLVQGPPGTGKTHTIANLLGYLLAQGKTVLVTAHTTKALRVLRQQVDTALQPLCLSVLGRDSKAKLR